MALLSEHEEFCPHPFLQGGVLAGLWCHFHVMTRLPVANETAITSKISSQTGDG